MESNNPVFRRSETFSRRGYATFDAPAPSASALQEMYDAPSATAVQTGRLTLDDVIAKTGLMFAVLLVGAGVSWFALTPAMPSAPLVAAIVALVLGMVISFKQSTSPGLILAYAAIEGVFVGGISLFYSAYANAASEGGNIVAQAVLGTLAAFAVMLVLYRSGRLRATPKFTKMLLVAGGAYLLIALASFVAAMFGVGGGWGFRTGGLGLLLCVAGVAIASFFLILDFDFIEQGIRNGAPARTAWLAGFGLMVTLVWLYLEILRLLAILRGND
jgi:uncharacterized YccA/Bax inhibitor family protein